MNIGIIGLGIVGAAIKNGFDYQGFNTTHYDINDDSSIEDILSTEIVYLCLPSPALSTGQCDTSIIESVIDELHTRNYDGIIAIKSTVAPGTTQAMIDKYDNDKILFVPEFLKERSASFDFIHDHNLLVVGHTNVVNAHVVERSHSKIADNIVRLSPTEAELLKYKHNAFNALRVTFANVMYELCQQYDADYNSIKNAFIDKNNLPDEYLDVTDELRGFAGACLPKDVSALDYITKEAEMPYSLWKTILDDNDQFVKTVFTGMRLE